LLCESRSPAEPKDMRCITLACMTLQIALLHGASSRSDGPAERALNERGGLVTARVFGTLRG
jgi:hypothetical protein